LGGVWGKREAPKEHEVQRGDLHWRSRQGFIGSGIGEPKKGKKTQTRLPAD